MLAVVTLTVCAVLLATIYGGLYLTLRTIAWLRGIHPRVACHYELTGVAPPITVFVAAFNEEDVIVARLQNIRDQDYPLERMEVLVVNDGSTDRTADRVRDFAAGSDMQVTFIDLDVNRGKTHAQNLARERARHEIIVSTDASTVYEPGFLASIVAPFADDEVGIAGGHLRFKAPTETGITGGISMYREMEARLRCVEHSLGVGCKTDAAATAFRRGVLDHLEEYEDLDQVGSLMARKKGFSTVFVGNARCWDLPNANAAQELAVRRRTTRKTLFGLERRWRLRDAWAHPAFTMAYVLHKVLRLFSPVFLVGALVSVLAIAVEAGVGGELVLGATMGLVVVLVLERFGSGRVGRMASRARAFVTANVGFSLGLYDWVRRDRTGHFRPTRRIGT